MATAKVQLQLVDVLQHPLDDPNLIIELFSFDNSKHFQVLLHSPIPDNVTINLEDPGDGIYRIRLMPVNYRTIQFFLRVTEGQTATRAPVVFPVNPEKVITIAGPSYPQLPNPLKSFLSKASPDAFPGLSGQALYDALPSLLKAALLNLYIKSSATVLGDDDTVFEKLGTMIRLNQDRLFAKAGADLYEETIQDPDFHQVNDTLHQTIPPYHIFDSYKTRDPEGNLQLTFGRNGETGNDYLVDMDIDERQGIGHLFEVLQNLVTSGLTNPYNVREILVASQGLEPLYQFRFAAVGNAAVAAAG